MSPALSRARKIEQGDAASRGADDAAAAVVAAAAAAEVEALLPFIASAAAATSAEADGMAAALQCVWRRSAIDAAFARVETKIALLSTLPPPPLRLPRVVLAVVVEHVASPIGSEDDKNEKKTKKIFAF